MMLNLNWKNRFVILLSVALLLACAFPTHDREKLAAMRLEAYAMMNAHVTGQVTEVPKGNWPTAIASLGPEVVWVDRDGVEILMKPGFDGGWGYFIPRSGRERPEPKAFQNLGQGVYWHSPTKA